MKQKYHREVYLERPEVKKWFKKKHNQKKSEIIRELTYKVYLKENKGKIISLIKEEEHG